jgi:hypothetical protein
VLPSDSTPRVAPEPRTLFAIEPRPVPASPFDRTPAAATRSSEDGAAVEVHIGRVEIGVRPPVERRAAAQPQGGRFDGIVAARRFLDRRWY